MQSSAGIPIWSRSADGISFSDVPTVGGGRMPDFCIVGAAKCGTTSLHSYLAQHPSIYMCDLREPNYFSTPAMLERGDQWYRGLFAPARDHQLCGEASTSYTRHPAVSGTARRIRDANPDMKIIYSVREPVRRTESDCLQVMKYAKYVLGLDHTSMRLDDFFALLCDPGHELYCAPVEASMYSYQLEQFEPYFPSDRVLIVELSNLGENPQGTIKKILSFLDLDWFESIELGERKNVTSDFEHGLKETEALKRLEKRAFLYGIAKKLLPKPIKDTLYRDPNNR